jgi:hypothetical protein
MNIINKMLRDLERRKTLSSYAHVLPKSEQRPNARSWWWRTRTARVAGMAAAGGALLATGGWSMLGIHGGDDQTMIHGSSVETTSVLPLPSPRPVNNSDTRMALSPTEEAVLRMVRMGRLMATTDSNPAVQVAAADSRPVRPRDLPLEASNQAPLVVGFTGLKQVMAWTGADDLEPVPLITAQSLSSTYRRSNRSSQPAGTQGNEPVIWDNGGGRGPSPAPKRVERSDGPSASVRDAVSVVTAQGGADKSVSGDSGVLLAASKVVHIAEDPGMLLAVTKTVEAELPNPVQPLYLLASNDGASATDITMVNAEDKAFKLAVDALKSGDRSGSEGRLARIVRDYPDYVRARLSLARLLLDSRRNQEAMNVLSQGLQRRMEPELAKLYLYVLLKMDQSEAAMGMIQNLPESMLLSDMELQAYQATVFQRAGLHDRAAEVYERLTRGAPSNPAWWTGMAISLEALGDERQALGAYRRAFDAPGLTVGMRQFVERRLTTLSH